MRTYLDTGVFIRAHRSDDRITKERARALIYDEGRTIVGSSMLDLELLPTARSHGGARELAAMQILLSAIAEKTDIDPDLVSRAIEIGVDTGTSGADAIHMAAADRLAAVEFVTSEKEDKPMYQCTHVIVTSIEYANVLNEEL